MLTDRLLAGCDIDGFTTSYENDFLRLSAKKYQLENTIAVLEKNLASYEKKMEMAKSKKIELAQLELNYLRENFDLYQTIFAFKRIKPVESYPGFFDANENPENESYKVDVKEVETAIRQHRNQAYCLSKLISIYNDTAKQLLRDSVLEHCIRANDLEKFLIDLKEYEDQINEAIKEYEATLLPLQRVMEELDRNQEALIKVMKDLKELEIYKIRVETAEMAYCPPKKSC